MKLMKNLSRVVYCSLLIAHAAFAAEYPAPKEGGWVVRDFRFHTGEVLPELKLSYLKIGVGGVDAPGNQTFYVDGKDLFPRAK